MKEREYPCVYGKIIKWKNRICVLPRNVGKDVPMLICFDFEKKEKKVIEYGAFGKDEINNIYETSSGTIVEGKESNLYRVEDLWSFMNLIEKLNQNVTITII